MLLPRTAPRRGYGEHTATAVPKPSAATLRPDHTPASESSASWDSSTTQSVAFGIIASLLALLAIYISYQQLRVMRQRSGPPSPILQVSPGRQLRTRDATKPQGVHNYFLMSSRAYTFHQFVVAPSMTLIRTISTDASAGWRYRHGACQVIRS